MAALCAAILATTAPALAAERPIRLWHAYRGREAEALEQVLRAWPGAPVETLSVPWDAFASKLQAAVPLGEGPDLFVDAHERLGDYHDRGVVAPAGDALAEPGAFFAHALAAVRLGGEPFGVPLSLKCVALYYNADLAGELPPGGLDTAAIEALGHRLPPGAYALAYEAEAAYYHAAVLSGFGGELLAPGDRFGMVGEPAERSLALVKGWIDAGVVPSDADGALVTQLFQSGRAAFVISGPWLATDLAASGVRYRVTRLPVVSATGRRMRPLLTVETLMLSPAGARRAEVRALARHLGGAAAARLRQAVGRTVSARQDVAPPQGDELLVTFAEQAKDAIPMPTAAAMRAVWEPAIKAIRKVLRGDVGPRAALAEAERRFADVRRPLPEPAARAPALLVLGALLLGGAVLLVRQARDAAFRRRVRRSLPAYRYVLHAAVAVGVLVFLPLLAGAAISLYAGQPGQMYYVGAANFAAILTARGGPLLASGSFYVVLLVTLAWTLLNVALHLGIGMALGVLLSRPRLALRGIYRVLLIVPWAVPSYVTALAWKGMFHRQFGAVTGLIGFANELCGTELRPIAWFSRFATAFAANLATNVWLGFSFMMVVTMAALTAVPKEVLEAAEVDGTSRWQRFFRVTLPIIRPSMVPAALLGAVWTFNMFNVVFLVSGGEPDGQTDILVSEAYRWAFTRQAQYGYAAAYAVLIFVLLFAATRLPDAVRDAVRRRRARVFVPAAAEPSRGVT